MRFQARCSYCGGLFIVEAELETNSSELSHSFPIVSGVNIKKSPAEFLTHSCKHKYNMIFYRSKGPPGKGIGWHTYLTTDTVLKTGRPLKSVLKSLKEHFK